MKLLLAALLTLILLSPAQAADSGGGSQPAATPKPVATPTPTPMATPTPTPSATSAVLPKSLANELTQIRALIAAQNYSQALTALAVTDKEFANNADVNNLLGFVSRKLQQYPQSATYYAKALKIDPNHLGALEYQGELFMIQKRSAQAKKNLEKLKKLCGVKCEEYLDLKTVINKG